MQGSYRAAMMVILFLAAGCSLPLPNSVSATLDWPEPDLQGGLLPSGNAVLPVPYSHGVEVVGHNSLGDRGGNLTMAWAGNCAYVANGMTIGDDGQPKAQPIGPMSGVAVIDVSNPTAPIVRQYLQDRGSLHATETLDAVSLPGKHLLAASTYGGVAGINGPPEGWLSLFDVSACANPRMLAEIRWPEPSHTIAISPDARLVFGTILNPFTGAGGIQVMDISNPAAPHFLGRFEATRSDGTSFGFAPHAVSFSADGNRLYVGVTTSQGADSTREFRNASPGVPSPASISQDAGGIFIFDISSFANNGPDPILRLVTSVAAAGWHSPVPATINNQPFLVNAGELGACPGAWPRIVSIADEMTPTVIGEFRLAANLPENCPEQTPMEQATGGMVGRPGIASSHFNDVDDPNDTRLGLFSFQAAGLRIADLSNPAAPREIAYFRPGDECMSRVRYDQETSTIWFACNQSGFWVISLSNP